MQAHVKIANPAGITALNAILAADIALIGWTSWNEKERQQMRVMPRQQRSPLLLNALSASVKITSATAIRLLQVTSSADIALADDLASLQSVAVILGLNRTQSRNRSWN